ncbi:uncharacterized protein TNCV_2755601 [Trichonephila clavipes]|nr:uncharacterized protein TNCV_2755601 [Trichonephila clavipes]
MIENWVANSESLRSTALNALALSYTRFNDFRLSQRDYVKRNGGEFPCCATNSDGLKNFAVVAVLFRMKNTPEDRSRQSTGLVKAIKLEGQKTVTANWYTTKCLPEILQEVNVRGLMLHHGNASSNAAGLTQGQTQLSFLNKNQLK